jgi:hypothetical protein
MTLSFLVIFLSYHKFKLPSALHMHGLFVYSIVD